MIQANELRIGNLVNTPDGVQPVIEINQQSFYSSDFKSAWAEIEPIPLTEEWLLRFGFNFNENGNFYTKNWGRNGYEIVKKYPDGFMFELGRGYLRHFEHVHQLQNLYFALTGHELNITQ